MLFGEGRKQGRNLRAPVLAAAVAVLGVLAIAAPAQAAVWFTNVDPDHPSIGRANSTGQVVDSTVVFTDPARRPAGLASDGLHLYWSNADTANPAAGDSSIGRATLDNTGHVIPGSVDQDFISGLNGPRGVAVQIRGDETYVYWADSKTPVPAGSNPPIGQDQIGRAIIGADGQLVPGSVAKDFITGATGPKDVDVDGNDIYWTNVGATDSIGHAKVDADGVIVGTPDNDAIDGADPNPQNPNLQPAVYDPWGIVAHEGLLYWTNRSHKYPNPDYDDTDPITSFNYPTLFGEGRSISRAQIKPDGAPDPTVVQPEFIGLQERPNTDFATGAQTPTGLATDGSYIYWNNSGIPFFSGLDDDLGRALLTEPDFDFDYSFVQTEVSNAIVAQRDTAVTVDCPTNAGFDVTCTVTVTDPDIDPEAVSAPAGTVELSTTSGGTFTPASGECALTESTDSISSCTVGFSRAGNQGQLISADYGGSPIHSFAHGSSPLLPRVVPPETDPPVIPDTLPAPPKHKLKKCKKKKGKAKRKCKKKAKKRARR